MNVYKQKKTALIAFFLFSLFTFILSCDNGSSPSSNSEPEMDPITTTYTVTFNSNGGSPARPQTVYDGGKASMPRGVTKADYYIEGWYINETLANKWNFDADTVTGDITLHANWVAAPTLTDIEGIEAYLAARISESTVPMIVNMNLGTMTSEGNAWIQLLDALSECEVYVELDLSACAMNGTQFYVDRDYLGKSRIVSLVLPDAAESITPAGEGLSSTSAPSRPTFRFFSHLTTISGKNITTLPNYCFSQMSNLTQIDFPALKTIGTYAFYQCEGIESIDLPEGLTTISSYAFDGCKGLYKIDIPKSLTTLGNYAFQNCTGLMEIVFKTPSSLTAIGTNAFRSCTGLTSVTLPNSITTIGEFSFYACTGLTSINLSAGLLTIDGYAFQNCSNLASINLPATLTSLGTSGNAFNGCSSLTSIEIPAGVSSIYAFTFANTGLSAVKFNSIPFSGTTTVANGTAIRADSVFPDGANLRTLVTTATSTSPGKGTYTRANGVWTYKGEL